jgi:hypothetical protein
MKGWQSSCVSGAIVMLALAAVYQIAEMRPRPGPPLVIAEATAWRATPANVTVVVKSSVLPTLAASPNDLVAAAFDAATRSFATSTDVTGSLGQGRVLPYAADDRAAPPQRLASLETDRSPPDADVPESIARELPYLKDYVYSELPPPMRPADIALAALANVPRGTPVEEIKHAAALFGLDYNFMKAVAKIESGLDPKERTGSYIGLFQLSRAEFRAYGSGDIYDARDNAVAAAYKFVNEAALFAFLTHREPTASDLYLIHQQGWAGAAEHVSHPDWVAWKSMCATDEGREKGERWCKHAIWWNTLPAVKREFKNVDRLTSRAFVAMWRDRVNALYARYAEAGTTQQAKQ